MWIIIALWLCNLFYIFSPSPSRFFPQKKRKINQQSLLSRKDWTYFAPNFEEVDGAYWFGVKLASVCACVHSSRTKHSRVLKFHIWILHGKIADARFFFLSELSSFLELSTLHKSEWNLMHAISYEPCILGFWKSPFFLELWPFENLGIWKKSEWNLFSKFTPYNLIVSLLLTAGHDTDGCPINTMF